MVQQEYDVILFNRIDFAGADFEVMRNGMGGTAVQYTPADPRTAYIEWFRKSQLNFKLIGSYRLRTFLEQMGYSVKVIDYSQLLTIKQIEGFLDKHITKRTKIVGANASFGFYNPAIANVNVLLRKTKTKYPHVKIVIGGQNCSSLKRLLPAADLFITGYGENALLAVLEGKVSENETVLDGTFGYGFPNEYLTKWKDEDCIKPDDVMPIETARGCIFACKFCSFPLVGKKKNDYIGDFSELKDALNKNYETYGTTRYTITEETFNDNIFKLEEIAKVVSDLPFQFRFSAYIKPELLVAKPEMIDLLVALGIEHANLGIESLNRETRKAVAKGYDYPVVGAALLELKRKAKEADLYNYGSSMNIICGLPYESEETFNKGMEYLLKAPECDKIVHHRLSIRKIDSRWAHTSPIDADPEKFGYTILNQRADTVIKAKTRTNELVSMIEELREDPNELYWKNNMGMTHTKASELIKKWSMEVKIFNMATSFPDGLIGMENGLDRREFYTKYGGRIFNLPSSEKERIGKNFKKRVDDWYNYQMSM